MRSYAGGGKSYRANELAKEYNAVICSADKEDTVFDVCITALETIGSTFATKNNALIPIKEALLTNKLGVYVIFVCAFLNLYFYNI
jgi:hypothetical protein